MVLEFRSRVAIAASDFELAERDALETLDLAANAFTAYQCASALCLVRGRLGRVSEALEDLHRAQRLADQLGYDTEGYRVGWLWRELGQTDRALEHDREAAQAAREARRPDDELLASLIPPGLDLLQAKEREAAWRVLCEAEELQRTRSSWPPWCRRPPVESLRCQLLLSEGRADEAALCARRMLRHVPQLAEAAGFRTGFGVAGRPCVASGPLPQSQAASTPRPHGNGGKSRQRCVLNRVAAEPPLTR